MRAIAHKPDIFGMNKANHIIFCMTCSVESLVYYVYHRSINKYGNIYIKSLLLLQNFSRARKSGNISHIPKTFFVRDSSKYETSDSDRKVIQNLYSQMQIHMAR